MRKLSIERVIILHEILIKYSGGTDGLRDKGLLESAINAPFSSFGGIYLYPTLERKAARLAFGIVKNHPFVDGNKRVGLLAMLAFLEINGVKLNYTDNELVKLGLELANGKLSEKDVLTFIQQH